MDEEFATIQVDEDVFRLLPPVRDDPKRDLLRRGIGVENIDEVVEAVFDDDLPRTLQEAINYSFISHEGRFVDGRFGDGTYGVLYTADKTTTAVAEVSYHIRQKLLEDNQRRERWIVKCNYSGQTTNLVGLEEKYPDLVSQDESGYPFCREVARRARANEIDALHTRSARDPNGICVPIFSAHSVSNPTHHMDVHFAVEQGDIKTTLYEFDQP